jgi:glycosyltransferase involved in cell wall biosynthesis
MHIAINAHLLSSEAGYRQTGVSRYISNLLPALAQAASGDDVRLTVFAPPGVSLPASFPALPPVTLVNSVLPTSQPIPRIFWEQFVGPLAIARHRPDVMLCPLNVVPLLAPCPTVVTVHDLAFIRLKTHRRSRRSYLSHMTRRSVRRSAHVIAVSDFTRQEVIELLGTPPARVTTVRNGCDPWFFPRPAAEIAVWRTEHKLPDPFLLFVGTLEPRKNLVGLIQAYAEFRKSHPIPLIVVGAPGWRYTPILDVVRSLGLEDHVRFEGFVSDQDLPFYYASATALIYPSFYEGFGLPPLEAMAMGTPVVTSNVSSLPEVAGDAAILVSPQSRTELTAAMVRVVTDGPLRARLIAAGLERVGQFNWEAAAESVMGILRTVAGGEPAKAATVELSAP